MYSVYYCVTSTKAQILTPGGGAREAGVGFKAEHVDLSFQRHAAHRAREEDGRQVHEGHVRKISAARVCAAVAKNEAPYGSLLT